MISVSEKRQGLVFTLVGPGGTGKNALIDIVLDQTEGLQQLATATTRPMRPNEKQGREHVFVTHDEFRQMIANDELLEHQEVHKPHYYGIPRSTVEASITSGQDTIADIEVLGATILRATYPDNAILIFVAPPSMEALEQRMRERGDEPAEIAKRLERARMEMPFAPTCDYMIVNDNMDVAADTLRAIVLAERSRRTLLNWRVKKELPRHRLDYAVGVILVYNDEVLFQETPPHFQITRLLPGELPHDAALRGLHDELSLNIRADKLNGTLLNTGNFVPPLAVRQFEHEYFRQITFIFSYELSEPIDPPSGWTWISRHRADFPQYIQDVLSTKRALQAGDLVN